MLLASHVPLPLARRTWWVLVTALLLAAPAAHAGAADKADALCEVRFREPLRPRAGKLLRVPRAPEGTTGTTIQLLPGAALQAVPEALAAFQAAADEWETLLNDPVTVQIDCDLEAMGALGPLGYAASQALLVPYDELRDALIADASAEELSLIQRLPTAAQVTYIHPRANMPTSDLVASQGNLKALGYTGFTDPDTLIRFNSDFTWDYDPSNGITPGTIDFRGVALHEIGHGLGFISGVDSADSRISNNSTNSVSAWVMDLFRLRPGDGATDFTRTPRVLTSGSFEPIQVFFDGRIEILMSTARGGDGRQASHLKDDRQLGFDLGVMDPTATRGFVKDLSPAELRIFGLIGWDMNTPQAARPGAAGADRRLTHTSSEE